jgi:peroxiredoxin
MRRSKLALARRTAASVLLSSVVLLGCSGVRGELQGAPQEPEEVQFVEKVQSGPIAEQLESGAVAPNAFDFTSVDLLTGSEVSGADLYERQPLVLLFSVPTCPICHVEGPKLANAALQNPDVNFVVVHSQGSADEVNQFVEDAGLDGLLNVVNLLDEDMKLWNRFAVLAQPYYVLVDTAGGLSSSLGALGDDGLVRAINMVLGEKSST